MKRIVVALDPRIVERVDAVAARQGITRSEAIESTLAAAFPAPAPRPLIDVLADERSA